MKSCSYKIIDIKITEDSIETVTVNVRTVSNNGTKQD